jgi:hypothetical protein
MTTNYAAAVTIVTAFTFWDMNNTRFQEISKNYPKFRRNVISAS